MIKSMNLTATNFIMYINNNTTTTTNYYKKNINFNQRAHSMQSFP